MLGSGAFDEEHLVRFSNTASSSKPQKVAWSSGGCDSGKKKPVKKARATPNKKSGKALANAEQSLRSKGERSKDLCRRCLYIEGLPAPKNRHYCSFCLKKMAMSEIKLSHLEPQHRAL